MLDLVAILSKVVIMLLMNSEIIAFFLEIKTPNPHCSEIQLHVQKFTNFLFWVEARYYS